MRLKPFLLDAWLDQYEHDIEFNLAASTGPAWTVNDILALSDDETRHRFLNHNLVYSRPAGADSLREAIAEMQGVPVEAVQIVTGASEALVALMWLAAEPGANVIIPLPGFTTFSALPESLGLETRYYRVRRERLSHRSRRDQGARRLEDQAHLGQQPAQPYRRDYRRRRNGSPTRLHRRARNPAGE